MYSNTFGTIRAAIWWAFESISANKPIVAFYIHLATIIANEAGSSWATINTFGSGAKLLRLACACLTDLMFLTFHCLCNFWLFAWIVTTLGFWTASNLFSRNAHLILGTRCHETRTTASYRSTRTRLDQLWIIFTWYQTRRQTRRRTIINWIWIFCTYYT